MQIMTVEILNENAAVMLRSLELLKAIRLYPVAARKSQTKTRLSQKYRGAISRNLGEQMQQFIQQSRDEWQEPTF